MANHMKEIAEILGVEFNEEFKVKGMIGIRYKLTKNGVEFSHKGDELWVVHSDALRLLLDGTWTVTKKPWKLKLNERYYAPDTNNCCGFIIEDWFGNDKDRERYQRGVVCKTKEEAIIKKGIMLEALRKYNESQE